MANYTESDYTKKLKEYLNTTGNAKPAQYQSQYAQQTKDAMNALANRKYQSQYTQQTKDAMNALTNRKAFSYDVNQDALYQQMKDNYISQGRMAMQDTMGQAAAMTGGYGNSYAQNAGQQAYQGYLQQLNNNIPEYYQMALNAYNAEGDHLKDMYNMYANQEAQDYGRWTDEGDRLKELYNMYANQEAQDYSRWSDEWNRWNTENQNAQNAYESNRNWDYNLSQTDAELARSQVDYMLSLGITPNDQLLAAAGYDKQYIDEVIKRNQPSSGGGETVRYGGGGSGSGSGGTDDIRVAEEYKDFRMNGANGSELNQYLNGAVGAGLISKEEAKKLKDQHTTSKKKTYSGKPSLKTDRTAI